jgi:hypothetical protein
MRAEDRMGLFSYVPVVKRIWAQQKWKNVKPVAYSSELLSQRLASAPLLRAFQATVDRRT